MISSGEKEVFQAEGARGVKNEIGWALRGLETEIVKKEESE